MKTKLFTLFAKKAVPIIPNEVNPPAFIWDKICKVLDEQDKQKQSKSANRN
jgi:hypothetical protein